MPAESVPDYPTMAPGTWWHLRKRFRKALPARVSREYLVSALSATLESAPRSTLHDLQQMQLVDDRGVPTDLARRWVDDTQYREVCRLIRERIYPVEIRDSGRTAAFAKSGAIGSKMASFYEVLTEADLSKLKPAVSRLDP